MDTSELVKKLTLKKKQDYGYLIAFFLVFSFFVIFVIRPNLLSVFSANAKVEDLTRIDRLYNQQIIKVIDLQTSFENSRSDLPVLNEAISQNVQLNKMLADINGLVTKNNLTLNKLDIDDINLKDTSTQDKLKQVIISAETVGSFEDMVSLIKDLHNQRRLKLVNNLIMRHDEKEASSEANLLMQFDIEGFYL